MFAYIDDMDKICLSKGKFKTGCDSGVPDESKGFETLL